MEGLLETTALAQEPFPETLPIKYKQRMATITSSTNLELLGKASLYCFSLANGKLSLCPRVGWCGKGTNISWQWTAHRTPSGLVCACKMLWYYSKRIHKLTSIYPNSWTRNKNIFSLDFILAWINLADFNDSRQSTPRLKKVDLFWMSFFTENWKSST